MTKPDEQEAMSRLAESAPAVPAPHTPELRAPAPRIELSALDGRSVAVHLCLPMDERTLIGVAEFGVDPDLGPALKVIVEDSAELELLIPERSFRGRITAGDPSGCDFSVELLPAAAASPRAPKRTT
jgi:hypothetical protein